MHLSEVLRRKLHLELVRRLLSALYRRSDLYIGIFLIVYVLLCLAGKKISLLNKRFIFDVWYINLIHVPSFCFCFLKSKRFFTKIKPIASSYRVDTYSDVLLLYIHHLGEKIHHAKILFRFVI